MNYALYLVSVIIYYAIAVSMAILIKDIGSLFDIVSAVCISAFAFFIPCYFYQVAVKKFNV